MVITVTLCKLHFFGNSSKKQEKEAGTKFVLFSFSRNDLQSHNFHVPIKREFNNV